MANAPARAGNRDGKRLAAIDQMLIAAIQQEPEKKREAINRILELVPGWRRGDCWKRVRHLRKNFEVATYGDPPKNAREPRETTRTRRAASRVWTPADDARLLDLAGYEPVTKIAQRMSRSVRAIRFRLGALGMSARVTDGWSLRGLRKVLHVSLARLR